MAFVLQESSLVVALCVETNNNESLMYLQIVLLSVSIIFQLLTLVAFCVSPEMHNLHGKSIACQTGTLMVAFIAFSCTYLTGSWMGNYALCKLNGKCCNMWS
jgi:Mn2+/Fe2+ NRAMP family transporter